VERGRNIPIPSRDWIPSRLVTLTQVYQANVALLGKYHRKHRWFLNSLAAFLLLLSFCTLAVQAEKSVLFLHTSKSNGPGAIAYDKAFQPALTENSPERINLYNEYTDLWRFTDDDYLQALRDFYRLKYADQHFDLIVVEQPPALRFLLAYGEDLFPGTPVVFCVMEERLIEDLHLRHNFTGVLARLDFKRSLESALRLQPDTRRVVIVGGVSPLDQSYLTTARKDLEQFEGPVEVTYLTDLPIDEIEKQVSVLPEHSIVFFVTLFRDSSGHTLPAAESAARIAKAANVPFYSIAEVFTIPAGGVGGYVWGIEPDAMEAAKVARQVLAGTKPQDLPIHVADTNNYIFDWRQLQRWGISDQRLPPGSILRNRDFTFWERYKLYVLSALALTIAQALLMVILLVQRARGAQAEKALRERLEFEKMLFELSASFVNLDVEEIDGTIDRQLREVVRVTGVEGCSILEFSSDYAEASLTHRYEVTGQTAPFSVIKLEQFPWYLSKLSSGIVIKLRDMIADLPEEAVAERQAAIEHGVKSSLSVPIAISQTVFSAISVFTTHTYCDWPPEFETRLRLIGEIFAQAMLRKRTEQELRASEARVRRLVDSNIIGVIDSDGSGKIINANNAFLEMTGYSREELNAGDIHWAEMTPSEYRDLDEHGIEEAKTHGACTPYEKEYIRKNGTRAAVLLGYAIIDAAKDDYVCFVVDVTHRKLVEQSLRDSQSQTSGIVNSAMDAIITIDANQRVILFNAAAEKMFRWSASEAIGEPLDRLIPVSLRQNHSAHIREFGETGVSSRAMAGARAVSGLRSDGEEFPLEASISQVETAGQKLYTVIMRDITERKRAEQELRDALSEVQRLRDQLQQENIYLQEEIKHEHNFHEIVGQSDEIKYTLFKVEQVAPTDSSVLIMGETGTGKELVARAIHGSGPRKDRPLVKINCATLPANLIESELFGHEKGAFTGAHTRKPGRFEIANGATLFLDEVGELPLDLQAKMLRVLQDGEFERVGGSRTIKVDVRIIAATNRNLKTEIQNGHFREDLWYRLSVFPITVPPLRQRKSDLPLLINYFVDKFNRKLGKSVTNISPTALKELENYSWPGNVRELANIIERAVINSKGADFRLADRLDDESPSSSPTVDGQKTLIDVERNHILQILVSTGWKIEGNHGAARILGLNPSTLRTRMSKLQIQRPNGPSRAG
jgi:formate hydrogenlyase transcriptional activator